MTPGIVGESDLSGNLTDEYVFFDGERVARKSTNGVFYYFSDHLKTASVITDSTGNIKSESDFYPWGGELQFVNNDSNHYKFTGKERDPETQLDYFGARYYSNGLGRWVSADWSPTPIPVPYATFADPQTVNLYGFVGGNPASKADLDGHDGGPGWAMHIAQWVSAHIAHVGIDAKIVRDNYNVQKASVTTSEARDALRTQMQETHTSSFNRSVAEQHTALSAEARAAKPAEELARTITKGSAKFDKLANTMGKVGTAATIASVSIAVYNVSTAPQGEKGATALKEGGGYRRRGRRW